MRTPSLRQLWHVLTSGRLREIIRLHGEIIDLEDRMGLSMVDAAVRDGLLDEGETLRDLPEYGALLRKRLRLEMLLDPGMRDHVNKPIKGKSR